MMLVGASASPTGIIANRDSHGKRNSNASGSVIVGNCELNDASVYCVFSSWSAREDRRVLDSSDEVFVFLVRLLLGRLGRFGPRDQALGIRILIFPKHELVGMWSW